MIIGPMSSNALVNATSTPLPEGALRLSDWGLIRARGADAATFLQGQLTNDLLSLPAGQARLAGFCSPKGRLLASFIVWKDEGEDWSAGDELDWDMYWRYNAMDCAVTIEIAEKLRSKLQKAGLWQMYEDTRKVLPHAFKMSIRGMRYDTERADHLHAQTVRNKERWQKVLNQMNSGEMPPDDEKQPDGAAKANFLDDLANVMVAAAKYQMLSRLPRAPAESVCWLSGGWPGMLEWP